MAKQQNLLTCEVMGLLPGTLQQEVGVGQALGQFFKRITRIPALNHGKFLMLKASSGSIMAFARWNSRQLIIVAANFSMRTQSVQIYLDPFLGSFQQDTPHLFNDVLHGSSFVQDIPAESSGEPAHAILGQDLYDSGLPLTISGLSLRLFSVKLTRPISHEPVSKLRQVYKD